MEGSEETHTWALAVPKQLPSWRDSVTLLLVLTQLLDNLCLLHAPLGGGARPLAAVPDLWGGALFSIRGHNMNISG